MPSDWSVTVASIERLVIEAVLHRYVYRCALTFWLLLYLCRGQKKVWKSPYYDVERSSVKDLQGSIGRIWQEWSIGKCVFIGLKKEKRIMLLRMNGSWVLFHRGRLLAEPCFYSSPQRTNRTLALQIMAFHVFCEFCGHSWFVFHILRLWKLLSCMRGREGEGEASVCNLQLHH